MKTLTLASFNVRGLTKSQKQHILIQDVTRHRIDVKKQKFNNYQIYLRVITESSFLKRNLQATVTISLSIRN